jgi:hypothetical protein
LTPERHGKRVPRAKWFGLEQSETLLGGTGRSSTVGLHLALDTELDARVGFSKDELLAAMEGHVLDEGELVGTYER